MNRIGISFFLIISIFLLSSFMSLGLLAQCNFQEDYSSSTGWTQVGVDVEILNGRLNYLNGAEDQTSQRRVHKPLGTTLDSNDCWVAELEFTPQQVGAKNNLPYAGHVVLALTAGTQEPHNDCPNLPCTGKPNGTQDGIIFTYMAFNPPNGDLYLRIYARKNGVEYRTLTNNVVTPYLDTTYYLRASRTSPTQVELSVYWDANRTIQLPTSPISLTIPAGITGLTTVQHGNVVRGEVRRKLWGYLDNLCITWNAPVNGNFLPADTSFCSGESIELNIGQGSNANYLWSNGSTDSIITITQGGTYWAKVESGCSTLYDTVLVNEETINVKLPNDTTLCPGEQLVMDIGQGNQATYLWNTGSTDSIITISQAGIYIGTVTDVCTDSDTIVVGYYAPLQPQLNDTSICNGTPVELSYLAPGANFLWSTGETTSRIVVQEAGVYTVSVSNHCGTLVDSANVALEDCEECRVFLPNAFTPGNDDINELFGPITNCLEIKYTFKIYDRWGKMVADLTEKDEGWDGTLNGSPLPIGVYSYRFEYIIPDKIPYQRDWINGFVTLLR